MGFFSSLIGSEVAQPIEAIGNVVDKLFTSDEERAQGKLLMEKLAQHPSDLQVELNKVEANHRSIFVAGWRPFIGWVCGTGLSFVFVINPVIQWFTGKPGPVMPVDVMLELILAMLGMGALRTYEKVQGKTK